MKRHVDEEINIFNFSFLDILCATIGALIFILLMIVLSTNNFVEKKFIEELKMKHNEALVELSKLEKSVEERQKEVEKRQKEVSAKNEIIAQMKKMYTKPSVLPERDVTDTITAGSGTVEAQKTDARSNLESKVITVAEGQIYLGSSIHPVSTRDTQEAEDAMRQFFRYYDENFEHLSWNIWDDGELTYKRAIISASSMKSVYAEGLKAAKESNLPDSSKTIDGKYGADKNNDGKIDELYVDNNKDGEWDIKYVNIDRDDFWEEVYIGYDIPSAKWRRKMVDTNSDNIYDLLLEDTMPFDNNWEKKSIDPNIKTGKSRESYEDTNNDGIYDTRLVNTDFTDEDWEISYTKYDPKFKRWKLSLVDTNGDGAPDVMWADTDMNNIDMEEKYVDQNFDGKWDLRYRDLDSSDNDWEALYSKPIPEKDAWGEVLVDTDGDGAWDKKMIDSNGDGEFEKEIKLDSAKPTD
ncbi:MAG: hypothetical protein KJ950_06270 [Proteobacteria bacterium]|nr:hypothetical protein [Pseudomonadota bacterium]MBU1688724.1 hypothetical protein [Pseudomonadota bacterium]